MGHSSQESGDPLPLLMGWTSGYVPLGCSIALHSFELAGICTVQVPVCLFFLLQVTDSVFSSDSISTIPSSRGPSPALNNKRTKRMLNKAVQAGQIQNQLLPAFLVFDAAFRVVLVLSESAVFSEYSLYFFASQFISQKVGVLK